MGPLLAFRALHAMCVKKCTLHITPSHPSFTSLLHNHPSQPSFTTPFTTPFNIHPSTLPFNTTLQHTPSRTSLNHHLNNRPLLPPSSLALPFLIWWEPGPVPLVIFNKNDELNQKIQTNITASCRPNGMWHLVVHGTRQTR